MKKRPVGRPRLSEKKPQHEKRPVGRPEMAKENKSQSLSKCITFERDTFAMMQEMRGEESKSSFLNRLIKESHMSGTGKGQKGGKFFNYGECNRTSCSNKGVTYFNHSTLKYYCGECAALINKSNMTESMEIFGHELCTEEPIKED